MNNLPCQLLFDLDITNLSQAAFQYGPFFFSLLFLYSIARWAHQRFRESLALPDHTPLREEAIALNRNVYFASFSFGVLLTVASVVWWWHYRPAIFVFQGTICALRSYEVVSSPILYRREQDRAWADGDPEHYRDERFVIIQDHPFAKGQKFELDYFKKGDPTTQRLSFAFPGDEINEVSYVIKFDNGKNTIMQDAKISEKRMGLFPDDIVYAQASQSQIDEAKPQSINPGVVVPGMPLSNNWASSNNLASSLVTVGEKLSTLRSLSDRPVGPWLWNPSLPEPLLVTLLDLTRYQDDELAYFARDYLIRINVSSIVVKLLSDPSTAQLGEQIFMHLDDDSCSIVLQWLMSEKPSLYAPLRQLGNPLQLVGTPSPAGDRYYVEATWDPSDQDSVQCLSQAFNQELISNRSLQDEYALMKKRSSRLVYWYGKDWAIHIRDRIISCGGQARFTSPIVRISRGKYS